MIGEGYQVAAFPLKNAVEYLRLDCRVYAGLEKLLRGAEAKTHKLARPIMTCLATAAITGRGHS
jgi:hypothetical protein